jgi:hypothetical protein
MPEVHPITGRPLWGGGETRQEFEARLAEFEATAAKPKRSTRDETPPVPADGE